MMANPKYDIFLSYNSSDKSPVEELARKLKDNSVNVFFDRWELIAGDPWQEQLEKALNSSRLVAVFIGKSGLGQWEQTEYKSYLSRLAEDPSFRIIPILLPDANIENVPLFLRQYTFLDLRDRSPENVNIIVDRIRNILPPKEAMESEKPSSPRIFLCHAKQDSARIEELYFALGKAGFDPWYDKKKLLVGDHWESEIIQAIEQTHFFAICLTNFSATKKGFVQKEIRTAVREYQRRPEDSVFLLPIRLQECEIPAIKLDETKVLSDLHWIDVFEGDDEAIEELVAAIWKQWQKTRRE